MTLPTISCPSCNASMSLDVLLGHQGARDALLALANLHPGNRLQMTALRYVGLFAPRKRVMSFDRVADVLRQVAELIAPCRVEWKGAVHPAPLDYWLEAMEDMLARRAELDLPMDSHNYLKSVVASYAGRASAQAERVREDQAAGRTPVGMPAPAPPTKTPKPEAAERRRPPPETFQSLRAAIGRVVPNLQNPSSETEA